MHAGVRQMSDLLVSSSTSESASRQHSNHEAQEHGPVSGVDRSAKEKPV